MSLQITSIRHLRAGNVMDPGSGAVLTLSGLDQQRRISTAQVARRLAAFPCTFRWPLAPAELPQPTAWLRLIEALSERARLQPQPLRVLQQADATAVIWLPVDDRLAAEAAAQLSCLLLSQVQGGAVSAAEVSRLWSLLESRFWNQTHAHLARAAQRIDVPVARLYRNGQEFLQLGQGARSRLFCETLTDRTPLFARQGANKDLMHTLLQGRGVPLPAQVVVDSLDQALAAAERIGWPVVLKPVSGGKGEGVWVGLSGPDQLRQAWQQGGARSRLLVQQMLSGADHRLLVVNGRLLAAAQRRPAVLTSDGQRSLAEQIASLNADPERGVAYERLRNRVPVDERLSLLLQEQGWSLEAVPPRGTPVQLSRTANISQGGDAIDCTDQLHPDNRRLAEDIALLIGSDVVGLDVISQNLGVSWRQGGTWLLEANLSAGLRPHLVANPQSDLCEAIVRQWLGDGPRAGRIPTALITGSLGKTTTSHLLAHILMVSGLRVGLTSSVGVHLDGQPLTRGDHAGGASALSLLEDRRVEALVAEVARGGLLKMGLGVAGCDVSAVLNVRDNHIGTDGIRSREDLARIKSLVAQASSGSLALNVDDPLVMAMAEGHPDEALALVGASAESPRWRAHMQAGHVAALYDMQADGAIRLYAGGRECLHLALSEIPAADDGAVVALAPAAAFAAAMAHCLGLGVTPIAQGLRTFGSDASHLPGRFESFVTEPYQIVLTKSGSVEAMESLSLYSQHKRGRTAGRHILLVVDFDTRPDDALRAIGRAAWGFDHVICASRDQRSGRASADEVPRLLAEGIRSLGEQAPVIHEAGAESQALQVLAELLQPGDFCVVSNFEYLMMKAGLRRVLAARSPHPG